MAGWIPFSHSWQVGGDVGSFGGSGFCEGCWDRYRSKTFWRARFVGAVESEASSGKYVPFWHEPEHNIGELFWTNGLLQMTWVPLVEGERMERSLGVPIIEEGRDSRKLILLSEWSLLRLPQTTTPESVSERTESLSLSWSSEWQMETVSLAPKIMDYCSFPRYYTTAAALGWQWGGLREERGWDWSRCTGPGTPWRGRLLRLKIPICPKIPLSCKSKSVRVVTRIFCSFSPAAKCVLSSVRRMGLSEWESDTTLFPRKPRRNY